MVKFPMVLTGYVIHNPKTGLYSRGGCDPKWGKTPKVWELAPLKNHLNLFVFTDYRTKRIVIRHTYLDCKIIDITTGDEANLSIQNILLDIAHRNKSGYRKDYTLVNEYREKDYVDYTEIMI